MATSVGGKPAAEDLGAADFEGVMRAAFRRLSRALQGPASATLEAAVGYVGAVLSAEERAAYEAAGRLGGVDGVLPLLALRFGEGCAWLPFEYVRLREPREVYVMLGAATFKAEAGWYRVPRALALACAEVNADARSLVFDLAVTRPDGRIVETGK